MRPAEQGLLPDGISFASEQFIQGRSPGPGEEQLRACESAAGGALVGNPHWWAAHISLEGGGDHFVPGVCPPWAGPSGSMTCRHRARQPASRAFLANDDRFPPERAEADRQGHVCMSHSAKTGVAGGPGAHTLPLALQAAAGTGQSFWRGAPIQPGS